MLTKQDLNQLAQALVDQSRIIKTAGSNELARSLQQRGQSIRSIADFLHGNEPALVPLRIRNNRQ